MEIPPIQITPITIPTPPITVPTPVEPVQIQTKKKIQLLEHQRTHFQRVCQILMKHQAYVDLSDRGRGKTFIVGAICELGYDLIVICPKTLIPKWQAFATEYGINLLSILTYAGLRGATTRQPRHELLTRTDQGTQTTFEITPYFRALIQRGVLIIFDEFQNIKNDNEQYQACKALVSACRCPEAARTRYGLLSGSPFDKAENVVNMLKLIGYINEPALATTGKDGMKLVGAQELVNWCRKFDAETTNDIVKKCAYDLKTVSLFCFRLYIEVIQPMIVSAMPNIKFDARSDIKNGYYLLPEEDGKRLVSAIGELASAARFNPETNTVNAKASNYGAITSALEHIEETKRYTFARLAHKKLTENEKNKVIIFMNYTDNIYVVSQYLINFNPMVMIGNTTQSQREIIVQRFQKDPSSRVLIANLKVGGVGLDLDDDTGEYPRFTFISPNYNILDLHQGAGRTVRPATKGVATIRLVYGSIGAKETSILNALARKSDIMRQTLQEQVKAGVMFPGDYPDELETLEENKVN